MADFGSNFAWIWLVAGVLLVAGVHLLLAVVAGAVGLFKWTGARRARHVALRALILALAAPLFPAMPYACVKAEISIDYVWVEVLAWLWLLFFAWGCWWLIKPAPPVTQPT